MFLQTQTPEQRTAANVVGSLLPTIKDMLPLIDAQESAWAANEILQKLQENLIAAGPNFKNETMGGLHTC